MTLDVVDRFKEKNKNVLVIGVLHPDLPFMGGDAEVPEDFFHALLETSEDLGPLFVLPRMPISLEDHLIGLYASTLVADKGTLQIGIGSLSDAIVNALILRHRHNSHYQEILERLGIEGASLLEFQDGICGLTEMLTDGFMHLRKNGILHREVFDESSQNNTYLHGSFFLGSGEFYRWLREMPELEKQGLRMTASRK